ncbi:phosphate-starvation-inducible E [Denitratisoma sp. DHT3]|uniref:phosphate-starvation-inducible protein PsiE n=1 Tax=Denitratisoma sp. DHT3 TaxID=1981880 RepID=UPI0011985FBA|nr:phosphate-starvation-inducible PsiE family protein [Denitratisoma sp. DHT3]QDX80257.1 phosphate-starvation-inducible E [Denitratisoma sp. DHT3]
MDTRTEGFKQVRGFFTLGLSAVEYVGLLVVGFATSYSMFQETQTMVAAGRVGLSDLLLMFLYLEVLAMIGQYFRAGQLPVRFPLYIAMVALARYLILDLKEMSETRMLAIAMAILLLTVAVLVIRYGHLRYPYLEEAERAGRPEPAAPLPGTTPPPA